MVHKILFLTLKVFSSTGGIEKVCRVAGKALYENSIRNNYVTEIFSMHDGEKSADHNKYFPSEIFRGFAINKFSFMQKAIRTGIRSNVVLLSHINLLPAGWLIKKIKPSVRIVLLAHGIEVWDKKNYYKRKLLKCCDEVVSVSEYTKKALIEVNGVDVSKSTVLNNCLDPYLPLPKNVHSPYSLKERYGFNSSDKILYTLSRLSAKERYKGYDKVMEAMIDLPHHIKYLIAGSYDKEEKKYIEEIIERLQLSGRVVLSGFLNEEELGAHFKMADCYVMPSVKEGFGIVFIEAMYYGIPVIAGNKDGSVDALKNGAFGILVDPLSVKEIQSAIKKVLDDPQGFKPDSKYLRECFSYDAYKVRVNQLIDRSTKEITENN